MANKTYNLRFPECTQLPPSTHSKGFDPKDKYWGLGASLPRLEMQMAIIFIINQVLHLILKKYHISKFTTQLITGILLSLPGMGKKHTRFGDLVFPVQSQEVISVLGELGYALFLFVLGAKMELELIKRTGRKAIVTGTLCILVPLASGIILLRTISERNFGIVGKQSDVLSLVVAVHSMTVFPVIALLLEDLKLLNSEIGRLSLSATLVCDIFGLLIQFVNKVLSRHEQGRQFFTNLGLAIAYLIAVPVLLRPMMVWVIRQTPDNRPVKNIYFTTMIIVVLTSGLLSHVYGHSFHFGPLIFGLAVPAGRPLGSAIEEKFRIFVSEVFLPIFVTTYAMRVDFSLIQLDAKTKVALILMVFIFVVKILATMVTPLYYSWPLNDAFVLALILSCRGIVQLALYTLYRDTGLLTESVYAVSICGVLVISMFVPILVKYLYNPSRKYGVYEKRDIMHLKPNAELKVLACIHRLSNMPAVINLLDAACPTKENPITVIVLHLIELIGRTTPIFISHQAQNKADSNVNTYSANVILYFNQFAKENRGAVNMSIFTAISPPKLMHEDICTLALDKSISLLILPFHRKWSNNGSIESEDNSVRTLNRSVLERAPCSVGILVDRGHLGRSTSVLSSSVSSFSVAVVFLGGKDDREALTFAKRMAKDTTIRLTVIHLVAMVGDGDEYAGGQWDQILDSEVLKEFRHNRVGEGLVTYLEEMVKDGPQTALILRSMAEEYDIIIVGRRNGVTSPQTDGLAEWSEFPELGTVGDLLASPDIDCKASIFVLQQQQIS